MQLLFLYFLSPLAVLFVHWGVSARIDISHAVAGQDADERGDMESFEDGARDHVLHLLSGLELDGGPVRPALVMDIWLFDGPC